MLYIYIYNERDGRSFKIDKSKEGFVFHILSDAVTHENYKKLAQLEEELNKIVPIKIEIHIVNNIIFAECPMWKGSYVTYYKTVINQFLPAEVKRILFIDVDTLVAGDIRELFHMDMQGKV